jgi:hypothetical protein
MPPKGNQNTNKQMEMPPKILHENTSNKTQNKKGNSFHQKQKIRRSDFLIKLGRNPTILKAKQN